MTNEHHTVLYTGVTSDLRQRMIQHLAGVHKSSFTKQYNINKLVYYEMGSDIRSAIAREKQIKGWSRSKKIALIESMNREWENLAQDVADWLEGV
jgi:putative endonuclease